MWHKNQARQPHFQFSYFFCFLNISLAAKLSEWQLFWVQNENGHSGLDFCATTYFFSKINVTFPDVWMILIELFDISISFWFQNFPRTNFSRYGGLYALSNSSDIFLHFSPRYMHKPAVVLVMSKFQTTSLEYCWPETSQYIRCEWL